MASAVVLVTAGAGQAIKTAAALRKIRGVKQAHAVTGPYDIVATVEGRSVEALGQFVVSRIQRTRRVKDTLTCPVVG